MSLHKNFGVSKKIGRHVGKMSKRDKLAKASKADELLLSLDTHDMVHNSDQSDNVAPISDPISKEKII